MTDVLPVVGGGSVLGVIGAVGGFLLRVYLAKRSEDRASLTAQREDRESESSDEREDQRADREDESAAVATLKEALAIVRGELRATASTIGELRSEVAAVAAERDSLRREVAQLAGRVDEMHFFTMRVALCSGESPCPMRPLVPVLPIEGPGDAAQT